MLQTPRFQDSCPFLDGHTDVLISRGSYWLKISGSFGMNFSLLVYLKAMQRHFGKVAVMVDRASPAPRKSRPGRCCTRTRTSRSYTCQKAHRISTPWKNAGTKESGHYLFQNTTNLLDMHSAVSQYYRTARFNLDLIKFFNRKAELFCKNF